MMLDIDKAKGAGGEEVGREGIEGKIHQSCLGLLPEEDIRPQCLQG